MGVMTENDLLAHASEYTFLPAGAHPDDVDAVRFAVKVSWRGHGLWAVVRSGECWGPEGWKNEASPYHQTPHFLAAHRYPLANAVTIARQLVDGISDNGRTWAQWQEHYLMSAATGR